MTTYTPIFGGGTVLPSQVSYSALTLTSDVALAWPLEGQPATSFVASTMDITSAAASYALTLPDATGGGNGFGVLINNLPASTFGVGVKDNTGNLLCTAAPGEQWMLYLADNSSVAGTWRSFRFGASTASINPTTIAGYGVINTSGTLSQAHAVSSVSSSPRTVAAADRAATLVWTGAGGATFNLTAAATLGNNFFVLLRNAGGGDITVDPNASETIDGSSTLSMQPGESAILVTDGTKWYSVGLGRQAVFAFDFTSINLASAPATYTLSGAELNRVAYKFTGLLTNNVQVIVPATIQQYWVDNRTTGAFSVTVKTASGSGVVVNQNTRGIYYCDGTNVVNADTAATSLPINPPDGGTGITSYTTGDLIYASSSSTMAKLADVATGNALISGGVGVPPSWGKIGLTTHVSGSLPVANGGTGASSFTSNYVLKGNGASGITTSIAYDDGTNFGIGTSTPGQKLDVVGSSSPYIRVDTTSGTTKRAGLIFSNSGTGQFEMGVDLNLNNNRNWYLWDGVGAAVRMMVDSSGNVGIGTNSPGAKFDVVTNSGNNIVRSASSAAGYAAFQRNAPTGQQCYDFYTVNGTEVARITSDASNYLAFSTGSGATERMRIDASGNVGIGTSSPGAVLDTKGTSVTDIFHVTNGTTYFAVGVTNGAQVEVNAYQSAVGAKTLALQSAGGAATFGGSVGIGTSSPVTKLHVRSAGAATGEYAGIFENPNTSAYSTTYVALSAGGGTRVELVGQKENTTPGGTFVINTADSSGALLARVFVNSSGEVGIGTSNLGRTLCVNSLDCWIRTTNGTRSWLMGPSTGTAFNIYDETAGATRVAIDTAGKVSLFGAVDAGPSITTGNGISTGDVAIELGGLRTGSGNSYLDFHSTAATDYEARVIRAGGTNGGFTVSNTGTGTLTIQQVGAGQILFQTNSLDRLRIKSDGVLLQPGNSELQGTIYLGNSLTQNIAADATTLYLRGSFFAFQDAAASSNGAYMGSNGRLSLGSTAQTYRLDVMSDDTGAGYAARLRAPATGAGQVVFQFTDNAASVEWAHIRAGSGGMVLSNASAWGVDIGGTTKLSMASDGSVTTPNVPGAVGSKGIISSTTSGTAAIGDTGKVIKLSAGITIPASVYAADTVISLYNDTSGSLTITQGSGLTMWMQGTGNTGNRTLAQHGFATIWFKSTTECVIGGVS